LLQKCDEGAQKDNSRAIPKLDSSEKENNYANGRPSAFVPMLDDGQSKKGALKKSLHMEDPGRLVPVLDNPPLTNLPTVGLHGEIVKQAPPSAGSSSPRKLLQRWQRKEPTPMSVEDQTKSSSGSLFRVNGDDAVSMAASAEPRPPVVKPIVTAVSRLIAAEQSDRNNVSMNSTYRDKSVLMISDSDDSSDSEKEELIDDDDEDDKQSLTRPFKSWGVGDLKQKIQQPSQQMNKTSALQTTKPSAQLATQPPAQQPIQRQAQPATKPPAALATQPAAQLATVPPAQEKTKSSLTDMGQTVDLANAFSEREELRKHLSSQTVIEAI